jgi:hypothetical protein
VKTCTPTDAALDYEIPRSTGIRFVKLCLFIFVSAPANTMVDELMTTVYRGSEDWADQ